MKLILILIPQASSTSSSQEYSALQPVDLDPQEGYMYMEKPDVSTKESMCHFIEVLYRI